MLIVRCVNGLVDPSQQSYFAESVMDIACRLGVPSWIVELRHDATHAALPSLQLLRLAGRTLLEWYKTNYWMQQKVFLSDLTNKCLSENESEADIDIEMDSNLCKNGSTFLINILTPTLLDYINASSFPYTFTTEGDFISAAKKEFTLQTKIWKKKLSEILVANKYGANIIVCHIFNYCLEQASTYIYSTTNDFIKTKWTCLLLSYYCDMIWKIQNELYDNKNYLTGSQHLHDGLSSSIAALYDAWMAKILPKKNATSSNSIIDSGVHVNLRSRIHQCYQGILNPLIDILKMHLLWIARNRDDTNLANVEVKEGSTLLLKRSLSNTDISISKASKLHVNISGLVVPSAPLSRDINSVSSALSDESSGMYIEVDQMNSWLKGDRSGMVSAKEIRKIRCDGNGEPLEMEMEAIKGDTHDDKQEASVGVSTTTLMQVEGFKSPRDECIGGDWAASEWSTAASVWALGSGVGLMRGANLYMIEEVQSPKHLTS